MSDDPKPRRDPLNRRFCLPRLSREHYQGDAVVHWTLTTFDRAHGWLTEELHQRFREMMLHTAAREGLLCPVYCLMPDHLHLVWMGLRLDTDQINGMAFLRTYLEPMLVPAKFQPQAQDHVLRAEQRKRGSFAKVCFYIAAQSSAGRTGGSTGRLAIHRLRRAGVSEAASVGTGLLADVLEAIWQTAAA